MNLICFVIAGPSNEEAEKQLSSITYENSIAEIRADLIVDCDLQRLKKVAKCPLIFTLRTQLEGGKFTGHNYEELLIKHAEEKPAYLDIEHTVSLEFVKKIRKHYPDIKIILSYHNFREFPDLDKIYEKMKSTPADIYKIAVHVNSTLQSLAILEWMQKHPKTLVIGMCVLGVCTRLLGPIFGAPFTFAALDGKETASGQLSEKELDLYNYKKIGPDTPVYGLIGEKIGLSPGPKVYNALMEGKAIYVLFPLQNDELEPFMVLARKIGIAGLSITMPFKEAIIPLLDVVETSFPSVNTLKKEAHLVGYNTDGSGAIDAIEPVLDQRIVILGAGGAAWSIAATAIARGAIVTILNRTKEKALAMAAQLNCQGDSLEAIGNYPYDILINTTASGMPVPESAIVPGSTVMDISLYPTNTPFLQAAKKRGCRCINGMAMWINQAMGQWQIWFGEQMDRKRVEEILGDKA